MGCHLIGFVLACLALCAYVSAFGWGRLSAILSLCVRWLLLVSPTVLPTFNFIFSYNIIRGTGAEVSKRRKHIEPIEMKRLRLDAKHLFDERLTHSPTHSGTHVCIH